LIIGSTGQVDANINVAAAMINGMVNGDIIAGEKIELGRTARVVGNIQTPRLIISDGAILEGSCSMVKSKESHEQRTLEQKAQFTTSALSTNEEEEEEPTDSYLETSETDSEEEETAEAATS
jgi:cytoskeletal protein CcmA (bactofilin family)